MSFLCAGWYWLGPKSRWNTVHLPRMSPQCRVRHHFDLRWIQRYEIFAAVMPGDLPIIRIQVIHEIIAILHFAFFHDEYCVLAYRTYKEDSALSWSHALRYPDYSHPENCHTTTATKDNRHLGQLAPTTIATQGNCHPDSCHPMV